MATLGNVIRSLRQERGLKQVQLARQAGMQQSRLSRIERGERPIDAVFLPRLARVLGVSLEELYLQAGLVPGVDAGVALRFKRLERVYYSLPAHDQEDLLVIARALAERAGGRGQGGSRF